jgi:hypothetical protein
MKALTLTRTVTQQECPWLDEDLPAGTQVWEYHGCAYGCISPSGIAVVAKKAEAPFFEIPQDAVRSK